MYRNWKCIPSGFFVVILRTELTNKKYGELNWLPENRFVDQNDWKEIFVDVFAISTYSRTNVTMSYTFRDHNGGLSEL
jgi:hypothetical protein